MIMSIIDEYLIDFISPFGSKEIIRLMIPMDRSLITRGSIRERLYQNIEGHIENMSDDEGFKDFLDDVLMMLSSCDHMTTKEATRVLNAINARVPEMYGRYEETILDNASEELSAAVLALRN